MVSTTQKRAQQAEYAMQLAQSSNQSQIGKDHDFGPGYDDGSKLKPRRRPSGGIEDINIISNIGQDSQQLKDRKKITTTRICPTVTVSATTEATKR